MFLERLSLGTLRLIGSLPIKLRSALGKSLGHLFALFPSREKKLCNLQMQLFLQPAPPARQIFASLGQSLMESTNLTPFLANLEKHVYCPNQALEEQLKTPGQSAIILSAHTGNWDLMASYAVAKGIKLKVVGREARNPQLQSALAKMRSAYGVEMLWRESHSPRKIIQLLKGGAVLAALIDQDTQVKSEMVPFFGVPAKTPSALIEIALKMNVPLLSSFVGRLNDGRYLIEADWLTPSQNVFEILLEYHQRLEAHIRRFPAQWVWFHKRWRSTALDYSMGSRDYLKFLDSRILQKAQHA